MDADMNQFLNDVLSYAIQELRKKYDPKRHGGSLEAMAKLQVRHSGDYNVGYEMQRLHQVLKANEADLVAGVVSRIERPREMLNITWKTAAEPSAFDPEIFDVPAPKLPPSF
jgi:hypothetical protein